MSVDFKNLRESYSLASFFEGTMGAKSKNVSGSMRYSACPSCGPSSDSSVKCSVRNNKWHCFSCTDRGDVIDAASKYFGMPASEAAMQLANDTTPVHATRVFLDPAPRVVRDHDAIKEVIEKLLKAQVMPDAKCLAYLESRGIPNSIAVSAVFRKLLITLPSEPTDALRYLLDVVGRDLLLKSGLWKEGSRSPAIMYRPLAFVSSNRKGIEFRLIAASTVAMAKAIRYGEPAPWVWEGNEHAMVVEGGIDMLSALAMGSKRTIYAIPGAKNWCKDDQWLQGLNGKNVLLALDADEAGMAGAQDLEVILKSYGATVQHHKHPTGCKDLNDQLKRQLSLN